MKKENELLKKEIIEIKKEYKKEINEIKTEYKKEINEIKNEYNNLKNIINNQNNEIKIKEQMIKCLDNKKTIDLLNIYSSIINDNNNYKKMLKNWINPNKKIET